MFQLFPNLRKVTLNIRSRSGRTEAIVKSILQRISGVKSLTIVVHNLNLEQYFLRFLSDLASFSQLEELIVWKKGNYNEYAEFHLWSVTKLIRNCQNLRVVKFGKHFFTKKQDSLEKTNKSIINFNFFILFRQHRTWGNRRVKILGTSKTWRSLRDERHIVQFGFNEGTSLKPVRQYGQTSNQA